MFGTVIKELRSDAEMTQARLAEALRCSQSMIARWEKGECEPTESVIVNAARLFNVSTDVLLGCENLQEPVLRDIRNRNFAEPNIDSKRYWLIRRYEEASDDIKKAVDKLLS